MNVFPDEHKYTFIGLNIDFQYFIKGAKSEVTTSELA